MKMTTATEIQDQIDVMPDVMRELEAGIRLSQEEKFAGFRSGSTVIATPEYAAKWPASAPRMVLTSSPEYAEWLGDVAAIDIYAHPDLAATAMGWGEWWKVEPRRDHKGGYGMSLELAKQAVAGVLAAGAPKVHIYRTPSGYHVMY